MDYYYDIEVNFQPGNVNYYEWLKNDKIVHIKKIPFFYISNDCFLSLYKNRIRLSDDLYKTVKNKTELAQELITCILFCDKSNTIVIQFGDNCEEVARSSLSYSDDENICELVYTVRKRTISYQKLDQVNWIVNRHLAQLKKRLTDSIIKAYDNSNISLIDYYYLEMIEPYIKPIDHEYKCLLNYIDGIQDDSLLSNLVCIKN